MTSRPRSPATSRQLPGLRAGYYRATRAALELHGVEWIRGVRISRPALVARDGDADGQRAGRRARHGHVLHGGRVRHARRPVVLEEGVLGGVERARALDVLVHVEEHPFAAERVARPDGPREAGYPYLFRGLPTLASPDGNLSGGRLF